MKIIIKRLLYKSKIGTSIYRSMQNVSDFFRIRFISHSHYGFKFVGNKRFIKPDYENHIVNFIYTNTTKFGLIVNVGANQGFYPLLAAKLGIKALAVEPDRRNLKFLIQNIRINNFDKLVNVLPYALTPEKGVVAFYGDGETGSVIPNMPYNFDSDKKIIKTIDIQDLDFALDDYRDERPILFIIDIEGSELNLIPSMESFIKKKNAIYIIEFLIDYIGKKPEYTRERISHNINLFLDNGFTCIEMKSGTHIEKNNVNKLFSIDKIGHDFLFIK